MEASLNAHMPLTAVALESSTRNLGLRGTPSLWQPTRTRTEPFLEQHFRRHQSSRREGCRVERIQATDTADGKITIGGSAISLTAAPTDAELNKAVEALVVEIDKAAALPANDANPIAKYIYQASGKKLTFAAKKAGVDGNKNDFLPTAKPAFVENISQPKGGVDPTPV